MKKILYLIICLPMLLLTACDVHEWPETPKFVKLHLRLNYETDMTIWEHLYDNEGVKELGFDETYDNHQKQGKIRYIIRTYPISDEQQASQKYTQEFVFTKDISEGYDHEVTLNLLPGNYNLMVWSDLMPNNHTSYYNANNFTEISLQGEHKGNDNFRDAFRGSSPISLVSEYMERRPDTLNLAMKRPLAKFEFITNDVVKFIEKELEYLSKQAETRGEEIPTRVNINDYKVIFLYSGFMPNTYNMNTDKPVDSSMGVMFESKLNILNENEASLGFDYVFVNGKEAGVSVQIILYDNNDRQISVSNPINVPLRRNHHSILRGSFLMQDASGGISINPDFDGNHNIIIK